MLSAPSSSDSGWQRVGVGALGMEQGPEVQILERHLLGKELGFIFLSIHLSPTFPGHVV
jgi:hypothetical protein